ncbi:hypothetical protein J6590_075584 [Homalodisca vitripennis]|nr:hypothetical protein J6590_075584 [Homalodisca vitripennis]
MIEDLLSKKETFQKRIPEAQQKQDVPSWLTGSVPPLYERVWVGVQASGGLADTPLLSTLLMSSGLSTDTLGYIWSLANRTVPGALTQSELYLVLALVGLAQNGYVVNNLAALHQLPQAPVPTLDLTLLPTRMAVPHVYPNPLNVTSLPDPIPTFNWTSADKLYPDGSEKIGISYVSSGPMVSPTLVTDQITKAPTVNVADLNSQNNIAGNKSVTSSSLGFDLTSNTSIKHSGNTYSFSFPSLNESPSHVASGEPDPFDDEFTDFQSADFTSATTSGRVENNLNSSIDDEDEFTNFQKASPKYDNDDLSVLVVGGKNIPSAQTLWVTDSPSVSSELKGFNRTEVNKRGPINSNLPEPITTNDLAHSTRNDPVQNKKDNFEDKYLAFQEVEDDKYSIFHNPLPEDEDRQSVVSESNQAEPKSMFSHSLFEDPDASLDFFKVDYQTTNFEQLKPNSDTNSINDSSKDSDEFTNFQNFPVNFPDPTPQAKVDKYDVFRTIVFEDNALDSDSGQTTKMDVPVDKTFQSFQADMDVFNDVNNHHQESSEFNLFNNPTETQSNDVKFGDFQDATVLPESNNSNIDSLFSSLAISEKTVEKDIKPEPSFAADPTEDKYKALRLLETETVEGDEFGEFFGAELPNSENQPRKDTEQPSIQIRCLEACLNLLKAGLAKLSQASSQDVVSEILGDPRANNYLDCLLEVHKVSERIISHLDSDCCVTTVTELRNVWDNLAPFFTHTEHIHLPETVGAVCGVCRSDTGPSPVTFGAHTFHTPCANLYLHCVEPVLPNIAAATVQ